jgi:very-short-patch-repair endonuclease
MNEFVAAVKDLRHKQTEAEKKLWQRLGDKHLTGAKFRRQEPIGNFIVDFVSFQNKLVIEIDGNPHREGENKTYDAQRTAWLKSERFRVIRFWNSEVLGNIEDVIKKIRVML